MLPNWRQQCQSSGCGRNKTKIANQNYQQHCQSSGSCGKTQVDEETKQTLQIKMNGQQMLPKRRRA